VDINKILHDLFADFGYDIDDINSMSEMDSLTFISFVVELERVFEVEMPDEFLTSPNLDKTVLVNMISALQEQGNELQY